MKASGRNRQIIVERAVEIGRNDLNEPEHRWNQIGRPLASYRPATARETLASAEVGATMTDVFEVVWSPLMARVTPKDRILFNERVYDISRVEEIGRCEGVRFEATARADEGTP